MRFYIKSFDELSKKELHDLLKLRTDVFVVEQACAYDEIDGRDPSSIHAFHKENDEIITAARIIPPSDNKPFASIGRVVVHPEYRKKGLGLLIMEKCMEEVQNRWNGIDIRVSAQDYLEKFYMDLGFQTTSEPYDWDGIIHIDMIFRPESTETN